MNPVIQLLKMAKDKIKEEPSKYPDIGLKLNECMAMVRDHSSHYKKRGDDILKMRVELRLSFKQVGQSTGLSAQTIRNHEDNRFTLNLQSMNHHNRILNFLNDQIIKYNKEVKSSKRI